VRHARARDDEALAEAIERDGVAAFVERWERLPLFASQAALPEGARARLRRQRLAHTPWGLANSLRGLGVGAQEPLWSRLPGLALPALVVVGDLDDKYREIGRRMVSAMPRARLVVVPGAGHAVHLERPEVFGAAVLGFLLDPWRGEAGAPSQG
jgi:2-succinyl-6-hydroxy-2,4-cyclohexadiene-1-carboxylate synthase